MYTPRREPFRWSLFALLLSLGPTLPARGQQPAAPVGPAGRVLVRSGDPAPASARFGSAYDSIAVAPDGLAFIDRGRTALFLKGPAGVRTLAYSGQEVAGGARLAALSRVACGGDGTLAFLAGLPDSRLGIYRIGPERAAPEEVVVTGGTLDVGDGERTIASLYEPAVDGLGGVVAGLQFLDGSTAVARYGRSSAPEVALKTGDAIGAEAFWTLLAAPAVNTTGLIAVSAGLESGGTAVLAVPPGEPPAALFLLPVPLTSQSPFVAFASPAVGDGGQVAFFFVDRGQLRLRQFENGFGFNVAAPGMSAPGGGTFTEITDARPGFDALGRVFFGAVRAGRQGFYLAGPSMTRLAETGMAAGDAGVLNPIEVRQPLAAAALDAAGALHFAAVGTSAGGLFRATGQEIGIEVRSGDPIEGARFASFIDSRVPFMGGGPALAPGGLMIFDARLTGGSRGLFVRDRDGGIVPVAMDGDEAPGGGRFDGERFAFHSINASGTFAFLGSVLGGTSSPTYALFYGGLDGDPIRRVIDTQPSIAPGGSAGDRVEAVPSRINGPGEIAVTVREPDGTSALWAYDGAALSRIAGPGDAAPGGGTFASAFTGSLFTGQPIAPALGDDGTVLFGAQTLGGDSALFAAGVAPGAGGPPQRVLGLGDEVEGGRLTPFEVQAFDREASGRIAFQSIYSDEFDFADFLREQGPAAKIAARFDPVLDLGFVLLVSPQLAFTGDGGLAHGVTLFDGTEAVLLRHPDAGPDPIVLAAADRPSPDGGVYVSFQPGRRTPPRLGTDGRGSLALAASTTAGPEAIIQFGNPNSPPVADAGPGQVAECARPSGADVTLDGGGSSDPEGGALRYHWSGPFGQAEGARPTVPLPLGASTVTLVVDDGDVLSEPDTVQIVVRDTLPPEIAAIAATGTLWPPDGRFVEVSFSVGATDLCDPAPQIALLEVSSSEPSGGRPGAQFAGAGIGLDDRQVELRADRSASGPGRTYLVTYGSLDRSGNAGTAGAAVFVPHDRGR